MVSREKLEDAGWCISDGGFSIISENETIKDYNKILRNALDSDIKEIGSSTLAVKLKSDVLQKVVLQVQKIRNVSAPKANEDSQGAPRMLKLTLTDGITHCQAIEIEHIPQLVFSTLAPGAKLLIQGASVVSGSILLRPSQCTLLGGKVPALYEKWELAKTISNYVRIAGTDGAPPWVNFGQKIVSSVTNDQFKSLAVKVNTETTKEFDKQRQGAIAEVANGAVKKVFGGGKPLYSGEKLLNSSENWERNSRPNREPRNFRGRKGAEANEEKIQKPLEKISLFDFLEDKLATNEKDPREVNRSASSNNYASYGSNFESSKSNYDSSRSHYDSSKSNYDSSKSNYDSSKLNYDSSRSNYDSSKSSYDSSRSNYDSTRSNFQKTPRYNQSNPNYKGRGYGNAPYNSNPSSTSFPPYNNQNNRTDYAPPKPKSYPVSYNPNVSDGAPKFYNKTKSGPNSAGYNSKPSQNFSYTTDNSDGSNRNSKISTTTPSFFRNNENFHKRDEHVVKNDESSVNPPSFTEHAPRKMEGRSFDSRYASKSLQLHLNLNPAQNDSRTAARNPANNWNWNVGDKCFAKYWEDHKHYQATVVNLTGRTCVVRFNDYGNIEEVLKKDCIPITEGMETPAFDNPSFKTYRGSMEFRRSNKLPNTTSNKSYK